MRAAFVVVMLAIAAPASGALIDVAVPDRLLVSRTPILAGHAAWSEWTWSDLVLAEARSMTFDAGNLTVCPVEAGEGVVRTALELAQIDCPGGETYPVTSIRFGPGTGVITLGAATVVRGPEAMLLALGGSPLSAAAVMSRDGVEVRGEGFRFAAVGAAASTVVEAPGGERTYNGTDVVYLHDGTRMASRAAGVAAFVEERGFLLGSADPEAFREALAPFTLLTLQAHLLGPDEREPRRNVTSAFREFGRVPELVNGAIVGHLEGTAAGARYHEADVALVRGAAFNLTLEEGHLLGDYKPRAAMGDAGISIGGGEPSGPPWGWAIFLYVIAVGVRILRRAPPGSYAGQKALRGLLWVGAFLVVDLFILARNFGVSALTTRTSQGVGSFLALLTFEVVTTFLAFAAILLPIRDAIGRTVPRRFLPVVQIIAALSWLLSLLLAPASYFALGYTFARL